MRPVIWIVREGFTAGDSYRAALFGAFTSRKFAIAMKKKILAEVPCLFLNVEVIGLQIGQRHHGGVAMLQAPEPEGEDNA